MTRLHIASLANLARAWSSPEMERPVFWRTLIGRDSWALLLITKGRVGELPPPPGRLPEPRLSPEWVRRAGRDLTSEELIHERIGQHLRHHVRNGDEVGVAHAASVATDAVVSALAELGVDVSRLAAKETP